MEKPSLHGFVEIQSHDKHVLLAAPEFGLRGVDILAGEIR